MGPDRSVPEICDLPGSAPIEIDENGNLTISALIESSPSTEVEWYKRDIPVSRMDKEKFIVENEKDTYRLIVKNISPGDSDIYKIVVSGDFGVRTRTYEVEIGELIYVGFAVH